MPLQDCSISIANALEILQICIKPSKCCKIWVPYYGDVIMGAMASQITSLTFFYSTIYSGADQRKHQSSVSLAFVRGIHWWPLNSPFKWPVMWKMFPFDDVIMNNQYQTTTKHNAEQPLHTLKTRSCHDDNFIFTCGTSGFHYGNPCCCCLWRKIWHYDSFGSSV